MQEKKKGKTKIANTVSWLKAKLFGRKPTQIVQEPTSPGLPSNDDDSPVSPVDPQMFNTLGHESSGGEKRSKLIRKDEKDNKSLFCLSSDNCFRRFFIKIMEFRVREIEVLDTIIWIAIGISSVQMAFDSPLADANSKLQQTLVIVDLAMTVLFTIEAIIKIIALGFLFNGTASYLRSPNNVLDLFVVVFAWIGLYVTNADLKFVKILRMAKLARPLKLVFRNENLRIAIKVLGVAIPQLLRLSMLSALIFGIFAVIGVKLFKGKMHMCRAPQLMQLFGLNEKQIINSLISD